MFTFLKALLIDYDLKMPRKNSRPKEITAEQQFGLCLGYILSHRYQHFYNSLFISGPESLKKKWKEGMLDDWDILGPESAKNILDSFLEEGHRKSYNYIIELYLKCNGDTNRVIDSENREIFVHYFEKLNHVLNLKQGKKWYPKPEKDLWLGTSAFDYGRMIFVARICYFIGYFSEEEAWEYINKFSRLAKNDFSNWNDYAKSYMLGRVMWNANRDNQFDPLTRSLSVLIANKYSPWNKFGWGY